MFKGIDFYSDTVTKPTSGMRAAIASAEVGDEQKGEDPTTLKLEQRAAELLGKSSALFFPCATMANEVAIQLHCQPGNELLAADHCHLYFAESGGPSALAGVMTRSIPTPNGVFSGEQVAETFRPFMSPHTPISRLVSVENTTNLGGGVAWTLDEINSVLTTSKKLGMKTHMDGSRLMNAAIRLGLPVKKISGGFDTVTLCLSKGLGCPTGAILAFDKELWDKVRVLKQRNGGSMRQSGMLAAAGLYALDHHVERLQEDHDNAQLLATQLQDLPSVQVEVPEPSTNMVFFQWKSKKLSTEAFLAACQLKALRFSQVGANRIRAVTHLDIKKDDVERAIKILKEIDN